MAKTLLILIAAFAVAVLSAAVLASVFSTQFVIGGLAAIDVDVPVMTRLGMTLRDLRILETLLPAFTACLLPAFAIAALVVRRFGAHRRWFAVAGASAVVVELLIIEAALGLMPIGGARSAAGLAMQGIAGAAGGLVFATLLPGSTRGGRR